MLNNDETVVYLGLFPFQKKSSITFHMVESKPTARTQAALDSLLEKGFITKEPFNRYGAVTYTGTEKKPENIPNPFDLKAIEKLDSFLVVEPVEADK